MKAAQIENNKVTNIAVFSQQSDIDDFGYVLCGDNVGIGWDYANGEFTAPVIVLSLDETQQQAIGTIKQTRTNRAYGGFSFNGNFFGKNELDSNNIASAGFALTAGVMTMQQATGGYWKNTTGDRVSFNQVDFISMARGLALFQLNNLRAYHTAKDGILAATTESEINDIISQYENFNPME